MMLPILKIVRNFLLLLVLAGAFACERAAEAPKAARAEGRVVDQPAAHETAAPLEAPAAAATVVTLAPPTPTVVVMSSEQSFAMPTTVPTAAPAVASSGPDRV